MQCQCPFGLPLLNLLSKENLNRGDGGPREYKGLHGAWQTQESQTRLQCRCRHYHSSPKRFWNQRNLFSSVDEHQEISRDAAVAFVVLTMNICAGACSARSVRFHFRPGQQLRFLVLEYLA
jgi:hypothetical protein